MINFNYLISAFRDLGVQEGDVLLVHSSFKSFGGVEGGPQIVIDALLEVLGKEGTLIVPTYNWGFCSGETFDIKNTTSTCGIITELVRKNPSSKRVLHPIYSHSVLGKLVNDIGNMRYKSSFGKDSVFAKLRELNGKIMIIGLPFILSNTFGHHVEEMLGIDYRCLKEFRGKIIDDNGKEYHDNFFMNVKPLDGSIETHFDDFEKLMDDEKITIVRKIGDSTVKLMDVNQVFNRLYQEIKANPHFMYKSHPKNSTT